VGRGVAQERLPGLFDIPERQPGAGDIPVQPDLARGLATYDLAPGREGEIELDARRLGLRAQRGGLVAVRDLAVDGERIEGAAETGMSARWMERRSSDDAKGGECERRSDDDSPLKRGR